MADAGEWRAWLEANHDESPGVWLVLAKKGTASPATLSLDQALEKAFCHGWIDSPARMRISYTKLRLGSTRPPTGIALARR